MTTGGEDVQMRTMARDDHESLASQQRHRLFDLTGRFHAGNVVTRSREGLLHARPIALALLDPSSEELGFLTLLDSEVARDVRRDPMVSVIFQDARHHIAWSGRAHLDRERYRVSHAWQPELERWFPEGPDDPRIALVVVRAIRAEYWSASVVTGALRMMGATSAPALHEPRASPLRHGVVVFGDEGSPKDSTEW